jgi:hypothetical protein
LPATEKSLSVHSLPRPPLLADPRRAVRHRDVAPHQVVPLFVVPPVLPPAPTPSLGPCALGTLALLVPLALKDRTHRELPHDPRPALPSVLLCL